MSSIHPSPSRFARLGAILWQRCPRCFRGRIFGGWLRMNDPCPVCAQLFEREEGYFLGAMYVSYALGCGVVAIAYFAATAMWPDVSPFLICLGLFAGYVPMIPIVFRYSRVIWLHLDYLVSSGNSSAGSYAKVRQQEINSSAAISPENPDDRTPPD
jgi:uncharacterized protein (DUF983 family)